MADAVAPPGSASWLDNFVTGIIAPGTLAAQDQQVQNQAQLDARYAAELADPSYTAAQKAQIMADQSNYAIQDVSAGNAGLFADTYAGTVNSALNDVAGFAFKAIPWWIWAAAIGAALVYSAPLLAKLKK